MQNSKTMSVSCKHSRARKTRDLLKKMPKTWFYFTERCFEFVLAFGKKTKEIIHSISKTLPIFTL